MTEKIDDAWNTQTKQVLPYWLIDQIFPTEESRNFTRGDRPLVGLSTDIRKRKTLGRLSVFRLQGLFYLTKTFLTPLDTSRLIPKYNPIRVAVLKSSSAYSRNSASPRY
jgi:hypothetical protein